MKQKTEDRGQRGALIFFLCFLLSVACSLNVFADAVYLKNGKVMTGRIVEKNDRFIVLRAGTGEDAVQSTIFLEDINRIETEEEFAEQTKLIPVQMMAGGFQPAWEKSPPLPPPMPPEEPAPSLRQEEAGEIKQKKNYKVVSVRRVRSKKTKEYSLVMLVRNLTADKGVGPLYFDVMINNEKVDAGQVIVDQLEPREERRVDMTFVLEAYQRQGVSADMESNILDVRIVSTDTGEIEYQREINMD